MRRLQPATLAKLETLLVDYPTRPAAVLTALYLVQAEENHLDEGLLTHLAAVLAMPKSAIFEVATFYSLYSLEPQGKHVIRLCRNVCCWLRGADRLAARLEELLGVPPGGTTADGRFTFRLSECLGACDRAPMLMIDDRTYGPLIPEDLERILAEQP